MCEFITHVKMHNMTLKNPVNVLNVPASWETATLNFALKGSFHMFHYHKIFHHSYLYVCIHTHRVFIK